MSPRLGLDTSLESYRIVGCKVGLGITPHKRLGLPQWPLFFSKPSLPPKCSEKKDRSLDVICSNAAEFELWFWGIQIVKHYPPSSWNASQHPSQVSGGGEGA